MILGFADCSVMPDPTAEQLADIAISSAQTYHTLIGEAPLVAMLSFSTKGSAETDSTLKVIEATALVRNRAPELPVDGELQFDAAFVPDVATRKECLHLSESRCGKPRLQDRRTTWDGTSHRSSASRT